MTDEPDYTKYSLDELREAQRTVDPIQYAERAAQIDLLIRDRVARAPQPVTPTSYEEQPRPRQVRASSKKVLLIVLGVVMALAVVGGFGIWGMLVAIRGSGVTKEFDNAFGDQHLKTVVALLELHHVRYGEYPAELKDLEFTGEWDQLPIRSVVYCPNADQTAYFIEVRRGWIGKPDLAPASEFWQGTGYDSGLGPCE